METLSVLCLGLAGSLVLLYLANVAVACSMLGSGQYRKVSVGGAPLFAATFFAVVGVLIR